MRPCRIGRAHSVAASSCAGPLVRLFVQQNVSLRGCGPSSWSAALVVSHLVGIVERWTHRLAGQSQARLVALRAASISREPRHRQRSRDPSVVITTPIATNSSPPAGGEAVARPPLRRPLGLGQGGGLLLDALGLLAGRGLRPHLTWWGWAGAAPAGGSAARLGIAGRWSAASARPRPRTDLQRAPDPVIPSRYMSPSALSPSKGSLRLCRRGLAGWRAPRGHRLRGFTSVRRRGGACDLLELLLRKLNGRERWQRSGTLGRAHRQDGGSPI